jgi:hypothetical protein
MYNVLYCYHKTMIQNYINYKHRYEDKKTISNKTFK